MSEPGLCGSIGISGTPSQGATSVESSLPGDLLLSNQIGKSLEEFDPAPTFDHGQRGPPLSRGGRLKQKSTPTVFKDKEMSRLSSKWLDG